MVQVRCLVFVYAQAVKSYLMAECLTLSFALLSVFHSCSVYFIYAYIPETSGLSLEAIDTQMEQASKTSKDKQNVNEAEALLASQQLVQQQLDYGSLVAV